MKGVMFGGKLYGVDFKVFESWLRRRHNCNVGLRKLTFSGCYILVSVRFSLCDKWSMMFEHASFSETTRVIAHRNATAFQIAIVIV